MSNPINNSNNNPNNNSKTSLEDIMQSVANFPGKITDSLINNTLVTSITGALVGLAYGGLSSNIHKINLENCKYVIPGAFAGYLISSLWKKGQRNIYTSPPEINKKTKLKDIPGIISDFLIENPLTTALTVNLPLTNIVLPNSSLYEQTVFYSTMSFITESTLKVLRTEKRIKVSKEYNKNESNKNKKLNYSDKASKQLDKVLEHPGLIALTVGITRASQVYYNLSELHNVQKYSHFQESKILSLSLYSGIGFGLMAGLGCILLGGVLHSESRKNIYSNLKIFREKNLDAKLKMREELKLNEGPIKTGNLVKIGNLYLKKGEKENALLHYKKAIKSLLKETHYNNYELLASAFSTDIFSRLKRNLGQINNQTNNETNNLDTAIICLANGNLEQSRKLLLKEKEKILNSLLEVGNNHCEELSKIDYQIDYFLFLAARYSNNQNLVNSTAIDFLNNLREDNLKEIGTGKAKIVTPVGNFLDHEIVIKFGNYKSLKKEFDMTKLIARYIAISKDQRFSAIYPLAVLSYELPENPEITGAYVMDYEMGETFAKKLAKDSKDSKDHSSAKRNLNDIADFLAYIHASVPLDLIEETRDHEKEISKRLNNLKKPVIPKNLQERIKSSLDIFLEPLKDSEIIYDKDAHSDNWMITKDNNVVVIDCENRVRNNRERDIANLTDTWDFFTEDEKQSILGRVNQSYSDYTGIKIDAKKSRYAYLNSVVIKALEDIPPLREREDFVRLNAVIKNAYSAISNLKKEFPRKYAKNFNKINLMQYAIEKLEIHLKNNTI